MTALEVTLAKGDFLVANRFSAADIGVAYHLFWLGLWPELAAITAKFPKTVRYLDRLKSRPASIKAKVFSYPG
jgi:glutathione S-transferase